MNNGKENARCGSGIWFGENHPQNKSIRVPGNSQSNQAGEIAAILIGLQNVSPLTPVTFITDSRYSNYDRCRNINGLTNHLRNWEDRGWIDIANSEIFRATVYQLRKRSATTTFRWIKGHSNNKGNNEADKLAEIGALKNEYNLMDTTVPPEFDLQGTKLTHISQALAYRQMRSTLGLLDITRYAIQNISNTLETDRSIWKARKNKDLSKKIPNLHVQSTPQRVQKDTESMSHMLTECNSSIRKLIWRLAEQIWPTNIIPWPDISIGIILGCGAISIPHKQNKDDPDDKKKAESKRGAARLLRIIISESAYLIWTIRCTQVIQGISLDESNITKRWTKAINDHLQIDRVIASKIKRNQKYSNLINTTWSNIISPGKSLPHNWVTSLEVLVGITLPRPPQTEVT
ncbi:ribonuclease H-like domain-containing protein [Suillus clintonianus]|uniref:ribonuclease H-like domain-containing protein n=1 Tax=Suillus clintonianus TaxID=1904413 RepID=UPI001B86EB47|nr:ribonuclease H-like domain-containing protein [Suillus clintonianus]KAG2132751.1 ribonuclease H-like domain-containing protein [Suillus clintonianus]